MNRPTQRRLLIALTAYTAALGGLMIIFLVRSASLTIPRFVRLVILYGFIGYGLSLTVLWRRYLRGRREQ
jgi:hypothetical protein